MLSFQLCNKVILKGGKAYAKQGSKEMAGQGSIKHYQMITPLLDEDLDEAKRRQLREEIAEKYEISKRSLYRYEAKYREESFTGLRPMNREKRRSQALPENWDEIVGEAIQLKREVPRRSVRQIIKILEIEGWTVVCSSHSRPWMREVNADPDVWRAARKG